MDQLIRHIRCAELDYQIQRRKWKIEVADVGGGLCIGTTYPYMLNQATFIKSYQSQFKKLGCDQLDLQQLRKLNLNRIEKRTETNGRGRKN